jgi:ABC-type sulfate transport system permease component
VSILFNTLLLLLVLLLLLLLLPLLVIYQLEAADSWEGAVDEVMQHLQFLDTKT